MSDIVSQIRIGWRALDAIADGKELHSIAVVSDFDVKVRAGRLAQDQQEIVLFQFQLDNYPSTANFPGGKGFNLSIYDIQGEKYLGISRLQEGSLDLFEAMLNDVVSYVMHDGNNLPHKILFRKFLNRVRDWQAFMSRGKMGLSRKDEIGLIGELLVLNELLDENLPSWDVIRWWRGPLHGVHDFEVNGGGLEVKTTVSDEGFTIEVYDLAQLDPAGVDRLYLFGVRLLMSKDGETLPDIISRISDRLSENPDVLSSFQHTLVYAGYRVEHEKNYTLSVNTVEIIRIEIDNTFPSLRRSAIPPDVFDIRYSMDLDLLDNKFNVSNTDVLVGLGVLQNGIT